MATHMPGYTANSQGIHNISPHTFFYYHHHYYYYYYYYYY